MAVTVRLSLSITTQSPKAAHEPSLVVQPRCSEPAPGVAVSVTIVPLA